MKDNQTINIHDLLKASDHHLKISHNSSDDRKAEKNAFRNVFNLTKLFSVRLFAVMELEGANEAGMMQHLWRLTKYAK